MSAELIYKKTLEQLAENGSAEARLALTLGKTIPVQDFSKAIEAVCGCLVDANDELGVALAYNDEEWTRKTDSAIERARTEIAKALAVLATK